MNLPSFSAAQPTRRIAAPRLARDGEAASASAGRLQRWFGAPAAVPPAEATSAQVWRLFATDAQECGDIARALQCWREVGQHAPDALDAMFHVACCHALLDDAGRAGLIFDALAHDPTAPARLRRRCAKLAALLVSALD